MELPGLTSAEAARLKAEGLANDVEQKTSRSVVDIFRANFLSLPNLILLGIVLILFFVGSYADAMLTGSVVALNVIIGSFQEYRSKLQLDRIALLTRPRVTVIRDGQPQEVPQSDVVKGDVVALKAGDQAVVDGRMLQRPGISKPDRLDMDESLLTGESDLIPKRAGDEILSGSFAVVGEGWYVAEKVGNESFAQKITSGARQFTSITTPLQNQIGIIVRVLLILAIGLSIMLALSYAYQGKAFADGIEDAAVVISLVPQGLLLMITVAYALGAVRLAYRGALVQQMNAVESISNVDVLCLDKTGTLTTNRILFNALHLLDDPDHPTDEATLKSLLGDYIASTGSKNRTAEALAEVMQGRTRNCLAEIPFSSARKWAAACFDDGDQPGTYIFGAPEVLLSNLIMSDKTALNHTLVSLANQGLRVLMFAYSPQLIREADLPTEGDFSLPAEIRALGLVSFSDELRPNVREVLDNFRRARINLKLISGDNPVTVAALAYQAGFHPETDRAISGIELTGLTPIQFEQAVREHNIFGRITPEQKESIVEVLRTDGHYVAMMGDGVNDVLSLKKAQVGIAMEDGSQATRSVADIVLLGNKFEVLPHAFLEGQRIINGMTNVSRLFLTRTLYTALLIIIAGFIGSEFPFTPRHNALLTTLPLGLPGFFLVYWAKAGQPRKNLLVSVSEFVFPAGFSLMVLTVSIWVAYILNAEGANYIEHARSVLTTAAMIGGLFIIILSEHEREDWESGQPLSGDVRRSILALVMGVLFGVIMLIPSVREFFEMTPLTVLDWVVVVVAMGVWALALRAMWRYNALERLLIPTYKPKSKQAKPLKTQP